MTPRKYPEPGSKIPPEHNGGMDGYVVGKCGHRVAEQEWRAGFRNCERCGGAAVYIIAAFILLAANLVVGILNLVMS